MTRPPRRHPRRHAVVAEQDRLDVGRVGDAAHDDVGRRRDRGRRRGLPGAELDQLVGAAGGPVPHGDLEPGAAQVGGHRRPHRAQPDEPDPLHARSSCRCFEGTRPARRQIRCGDGVAGRRATPTGDGAAGVRADRGGPRRDHRRRADRGRHRGAQPRRPDLGRPGEAQPLAPPDHDVDRQAGDDHRSRRGDAEHDQRAHRRVRGRDPGPGRRLGRAVQQPRLQHPRAAAARGSRRAGSRTSAPGFGRSRA